MENNILHDEILKQGAEGLEFNLRLFEVLEKVQYLSIGLFITTSIMKIHFRLLTTKQTMSLLLIALRR